jgi:hypothetical protein
MSTKKDNTLIYLLAAGGLAYFILRNKLKKDEENLIKLSRYGGSELEEGEKLILPSSSKKDEKILTDDDILDLEIKEKESKEQFKKRKKAEKLKEKEEKRKKIEQKRQQKKEVKGKVRKEREERKAKRQQRKIKREQRRTKLSGIDYYI